MNLSDPSSIEQSEQAQMDSDVAVVLQAALEYHQNQEFDQAEGLYRQILDVNPAQLDTNYHLGLLLVQTGRAPQALSCFETAIGVVPHNIQYWYAYIDALIRANQIPAGWIALELGQKHGLGGYLADDLIRRMTDPTAMPVVTQVPASVPAVAPQASDSPEAPGDAARRVSPDQMNRFAVVFNKGQFADAIKLARTMTQRFPSDSAAWRALGISLNRHGDVEGSIQPLKKAADLNPGDTQSRFWLADALVVKHRFDEAEAECRTIIATAPEHADAHRILGLALFGLGKFEDGVATCKRAIELAPRSPTTYGTLGLIFLESGRIPEAIDYLRSAIEVDPNDSASYSNLLFCLVHKEDIDQAALLAEHRNFAKCYEAPLAKSKVFHANSKAPERQLKVGFVSGDMFNHAVASYVLPVMEGLAGDTGLRMHVYYNHSVEDGRTAQLRKLAHKWRSVSRMSDDQLVSAIKADGIDILIDLSGHTGRNRLRAFARKPAPVQASWIGYPATTGLSSIDYYLADRFCAPLELASGQFTESLVHLPAIAPFTTPTSCPPINILPASHNGYITFGSFNRINKVRAEVIALWAEVMRALPSSKMLVGAIRRNSDGSDEAMYVEHFAKGGISRDRLIFKPRSSTAVYLQQHHQVDLCLDAFPFSASTTTLNALWMGVPTLTMAGDSVVSRGSTTWLSHVGLERFVTRTKEEFVQSAVSMAGELPALNELRLGLRDRCMQSAAFQPEVIAQGVSRAFRIMWQRWCAGAGAAHIDVSHPSSES